MSLYPPFGSHHHAPAPPRAGPSQRGMHFGGPAVPFQPPRANNHHQQQQLHHDHNAFRHYYASQLATLTFNSRPIIQNLSMIAQQYIHWANIVTECLEAHIRRVPPHMKLPAFYLLDSICKNVFSEYAHRFAPIVVNLFIDAHHSVDPQTQAKMDEMLITWRTGAPGGRELFGVVPQIDLERSVFGGQHAGPSHALQHGPSQPPPLTKRQVLAELEVVLAQKERSSQTNPFDQESARQVPTLQQLRNMLQYSEVASNDLLLIQQQLATMSSPPPPPASSAPSAHMNHSYTANDSSAYMSNIPPVPAVPTFVAPTVSPGFSVPLPAPFRPEATASGSPDLSRIYDTLLRAGLVSAAAAVNSVKPNDIGDTAVEFEAAYEVQILAMDVATSSVDITRKRPAVSSLLYKRLSAQCKQCSMRFSDNDTGKKSLQDHLDEHFRQNMRAAQTTGRGHSRSWFVGYEDWTTEKSPASAKGKSKAAAAEAAAEREARLRAATVIVPPGEEAQPVQCPICKEYLKSEFQEDDEEWIWRNAIRLQEKIYHATCHADAIFRNPLVARLMGDAAESRSRSRTPEVTTKAPSSPTRASLSPGLESRGVKRKAEDDNVVVKQEESITPPLKRIALSPSTTPPS
ncbi:hypothetical protein BKA62DRAFT_690526 [Auriculariales sp. MPI-PUGE-AT-0066]|nr:hypothetical protein BKA62DRAFT_690526 [Auriculariales sp. MPI-PUGE-AT-0066]